MCFNSTILFYFVLDHIPLCAKLTPAFLLLLQGLWDSYVVLGIESQWASFKARVLHTVLSV